MNASELKDKLIENTDLLEKILDAFGFHKIKINNAKCELRCADVYGENDTAVWIDLNTLHAKNYRTNTSGDLYSLLMESSKMSFFDTHTQLERFVNDNTFSMVESKKLFGGFFNRINAIESDDYIYDNDILEKYQNIPCLRFYNDGISVDIQRKFGIMYDNLSHRIIVPWLTERGIAGTVGRYNGDFELDNVPKWLAIDRFSKSNYLYGAYQNYKDIVRVKKIYVGESEKFPMQLASHGINLGVSVGSHSISDKQAALIKYMANEVILCFDEGLDEQILIDQCKKIKTGLFNNTKVGYVYDSKNEILVKGEKQAPSDVNINDFKRLISEFVKYV